MRRIVKRGWVHRRPQEAPPAPTFDAGWNAASAAPFIGVSSDKTTATYTDLENWTGVQSVKALAIDGSIRKVYLEVLFDTAYAAPTSAAGGEQTENFSDPQYMGLIDPTLSLTDDGSGTYPEHASVALYVQCWEPGFIQGGRDISHIEWGASGSALGYSADDCAGTAWDDSAEWDTSRRVMIAWDRDTNQVCFGQGGIWIVGNPTGQAEAAVDSFSGATILGVPITVTGDDLVFYIYSLQPEVAGNFSAEQLAYIAPPGYAACDGSIQAGVLTLDGGGPVSIPSGDTGGVSSVITVADDTTVSAVEVTVTLTHPVFWDLTVTIAHGAQSWNVVLEPQGAGTLTFSRCIPFSGNAQGSWTLKVIDAWADDVGTLDEWFMRLLPASE